MKIKVFQSGISALAFIVICLFAIGVAHADVVYYPVTLATIDPSTGVQQQHTVYVPIDTNTGAVQGANGTAVGGVGGYDQNSLPSNPWAVSLPNSATQAQTAQPTVTTAANGNVALRDKALPEWSGQNTTWDTARGQEMIAPEINKDNMLKITTHLRSLGYQVPDSLDEAIASAPEKTRLALIRATAFVQKGGSDGSSPVLKAIGKISRDLEENYGFSFENIMDTSMKVLDSK